MNTAGLTAWYDRLMSLAVYRELFEDSGFFNFGYWAGGACSQREASEHLVARLLAAAPQGPGVVFDVACGLGATTAVVQACRPQMHLLAVNLSHNQLRSAAMRAPGAGLAAMDAARPGLKSGSVDGLLCVEAAFHFRTRQRFFVEAARLLRPGGVLMLSDILFRRLSPYEGPYTPAGNHLSDPQAYKRQVEDAGFVDVQVVDATEATWNGHRRHVLGWTRDRLRRGRMGLADACRALSFPLLGSLLIGRYLLVSAVKAGKDEPVRRAGFDQRIRLRSPNSCQR